MIKSKLSTCLTYARFDVCLRDFSTEKRRKKWDTKVLKKILPQDKYQLEA